VFSLEQCMTCKFWGQNMLHTIQDNLQQQTSLNCKTRREQPVMGDDLLTISNNTS
jgi:hypothetical protein